MATTSPIETDRADLAALAAIARRVTGSDACVILRTDNVGSAQLEAQEGLVSRERAELEKWLERVDYDFFGQRFEGVLSAAIVHDGQGVGTVFALRRGPGTFDNADLLADLAAQAGLALALAAQPPTPDALSGSWASLDQLVLSTHSLGDFGRALTRVVGPEFGAAKLGVMVADRQRTMLQMLPGAFDADDDSTVPRPVSFFDSRSSSARVFMIGLPHIGKRKAIEVGGSEHDPDGPEEGQVLTVPLGTIGVLHIASRETEFSRGDVIRAQVLAPRIASLVELADAHFRLRRERGLEESLSQLAISVASGESIYDSLPPALRVLREATQANLVAFVPSEGEQIVARDAVTSRTLEHAVIDEAGTEPGMRAYVVSPREGAESGWAVFYVPVALRGVRVGTLAALRARDEPFARSERRSFTRVANIAALNHAMERYQQNRAEVARLQERQRIADDLHDDVAQILFAAQLALDSVVEQHPGDPDLNASIARARGLLIRGDRAIRAVIHRLARPPAGDIASRLAAVVTSVEEEFEIAIHLAVDPDAAAAARGLRKGLNDALAKAAREALVNVAKHAGPCRVGVRLEVVRERLILSVADDGLGVPSPRRSGGHGLASLRRLIREHGGSLRLIRGSGGGTKLTVSVPVPPTPGRGRHGNGHGDSAVPAASAVDAVTRASQH